MTGELTLSVVIPARNAERTLPLVLEALGRVAETIVVDGDSTDRTRDVAAARQVRVMSAPRGRGRQIAAGIAEAQHPWLLLLHADTRLQPGWREEAAAHMEVRPDLAGYFRFALDSRDPKARRLERLVAWRCRVFGLPYGDQGLLIHRDLLRSVGGMWDLPLMEDVDLVRRLRRHRLIGFNTAVLTSAEKWEREGWYRRSARNLCCLALWFVGVPVRWIVRLYG